jgi:putative oxidoreductase
MTSSTMTSNTMTSNTMTANARMANAIGPDTASLPDVAAATGRIALASLFLWSGYGKFAHAAGTIGYMQAYGVPAADLLVWPVALVEVLAGLALVLGWKSRWAALALIAFTLPASFIFHAYWGVPADQIMNQQIHFMKNLAIVGGLLSVFAHGSGRYALDRP